MSSSFAANFSTSYSLTSADSTPLSANSLSCNSQSPGSAAVKMNCPNNHKCSHPHYFYCYLHPRNQNHQVGHLQHFRKVPRRSHDVIYAQLASGLHEGLFYPSNPDPIYGHKNSRANATGDWTIIGD